MLQRIGSHCHRLARQGVNSLRFASVVVLLLWPQTSFSQTPSAELGSIAGRIIPQHDHDFVLATARLSDLGLQTDVQADGTFRFQGVRPGSYIVEVRVPSIGLIAERVKVVAGEEAAVEVVLRPGSHSEEIVVTASGDTRDPFELATPTTSLSGEELALKVDATLGETLAQEPGINSTFFGPGASRPIIRGLGGDRVRTLEGGLGTGDASGVSADHAVATDPAQAERIEVLRGPGTLLYGSSAIGGVVNVIDERIPTVRAAAGLHGSVSLQGGSGNGEVQGSAAVSGGQGNWAWQGSASGRSTDDYDSPFGTVTNSDLETQGGRLGGTYFFGDRGFAGVSVSGFDTEYGLPASDVRIDLEQRRLDLKSQILQPWAGFQALKIRLGATDYEHVELEGDEVGTFFFNDVLEGRVELVQERRGRYSGSLGAQYFDRDLEAVGEEAFLPKTATSRWALFTLQEIDAGPLTWQLGARFENQTIDPAALSTFSHDGVSGSLGLVWKLNATFSVAASAARSVKLPAPEELFSNGLHAATQAFEVGNPNLQEEIGLGLDLSLRAQTEGVSGELTLFRQGFDGFIFQALTGEEEEGFPVGLYSQEDAVFQGAELSARVEVYEHEGRHVHLSFMGDLVEAELDRGGNLPRIPPMRLGGGIHFHSEKWNASTEVRWVDGQDRVAVNETPTDGYTFVNASLGYRILLREQIVDILLRGRNLGDEEARSHTSFLKDVAPLPGRDVTLSVKLQF